MRAAVLALMLLPALPVSAGTLPLAPVEVVEWKSVFATVAPRHEVPARARIGGTLTALEVSEGDRVGAGAAIGLVEDQKLDFQLAALEAQIGAAQSQLDNAGVELARAEELAQSGVSTVQRRDQLRTQVDVLEGQLRSLTAERDRVMQTRDEGRLIAPADGIVLTAPVATGEVVMPGETVVTVGTGGFFLRLQVPERHAAGLREGDAIRIGEGEGARTGRLAKVYPLIQGGRVQADIEVEGLDPRFSGARIAVRLPVGRRMALAVPAAAVTHRGGLDFVSVMAGGTVVERAVVPGGPVEVAGQPMVEIVSGLTAGETLVIADE